MKTSKNCKNCKNCSKIEFYQKVNLKQEIDKLRDKALDLQFSLNYLDKYLSILESVFYRVEKVDDFNKLSDEVSELKGLLNSSLNDFMLKIKDF